MAAFLAAWAPVTKAVWYRGECAVVALTFTLAVAPELRVSPLPEAGSTAAAEASTPPAAPRVIGVTSANGTTYFELLVPATGRAPHPVVLVLPNDIGAQHSSSYADALLHAGIAVLKATVADDAELDALVNELGRRGTFLGCCAGVVALTAVWALAANQAMFMAYAVGFVALLPAFTTDRFGRHNAAKVIGILWTGRGLGLLIAAPLLALMVEWRGGYTMPLGLAVMLGAAGVVLIAFSPPRPWASAR